MDYIYPTELEFEEVTEQFFDYARDKFKYTKKSAWSNVIYYYSLDNGKEVLAETTDGKYWVERELLAAVILWLVQDYIPDKYFLKPKVVAP